MTTTNLTIYCEGIESLGAPSFSARKLGTFAAELNDVNAEAVVEELLNGVGADAILDEIPKEEIIEYLESLGYEVKEVG